MTRRSRRRRGKKLSIRERKKKMLKSSEWILLGVLFVGLAEGVVKHYEITWRYLPYAFAVCGILAIRILLSFLRIFTSGMSTFLDSIKDP
jgi:hypothetical protein